LRSSAAAAAAAASLQATTFETQKPMSGDRFEGYGRNYRKQKISDVAKGT
jgi:hypothetical protein